VTEDEVQREHAGLRRHAGGVRGGRDDEVDVAGTQLLQRLRLSAELRTRKLVDGELAAAELLELLVEDVGGDAVGGGGRLVGGEAELRLGRRIRGRSEDQRADGQHREGSVDDHTSSHGRVLPGEESLVMVEPRASAARMVAEAAGPGQGWTLTCSSRT